MKISIDFGTTFTYIATCDSDGRFIPLLPDKDKGYPTTIEAQRNTSGRTIGENSVLLNGTIFTCYSGKGSDKVKQKLIELIQNAPTKSETQILNTCFDSSDSNLNYFIKDIFTAFFAVLLKKTKQFCDENSTLLEQMGLEYKTLEAIYIAFPKLSRTSSIYESALIKCMQSAVANSTWTTSSNMQYTCVEEAKCLPYALDYQNNYKMGNVLFVDIGGYTSDYCYLNSNGTLSSRNDALSTEIGTGIIDKAILYYIANNESDLLSDLIGNPLKFDTIKRNIEQGLTEERITPEIYNGLQDNRENTIWDLFKEELFVKLRESFSNTNTIVLSGGGSNINNIINGASNVFNNAIITNVTEQLARQKKNESSLNSKSIICYGAHLLAEDASKCSSLNSDHPSHEYTLIKKKQDQIMANDGVDLFNNYGSDQPDKFNYSLLAKGPYSKDSYSKLKGFSYAYCQYPEKLFYGKLKVGINLGDTIKNNKLSEYISTPLNELNPQEDNIIQIEEASEENEIHVLIGVITYTYDIISLYHVLAIYNDSGEAITVKNGNKRLTIQNHELIRDIIFLNRVVIENLTSLKRAPKTLEEYQRMIK